MRIIIPLLFLTGFIVSSPSFSISLSLDEFLREVKEKNQAFQSAVELAKAAKERRQEKNIAFAPTLYSNAQLTGDAKLPMLPFFTYSQINSHAYSLGVSKMTSFGLQAKLSYNLAYTSYINASMPGGPPLSGVPLHFYDAAPKLEVTQSLWSNGFGRGARATEALIDSQALANEYNARFQARSLLAQAEAAYWRLIIARSTVSIERRALEQAEKLFQYTSRRARMHLGESADALQSKAAYEVRKLELKSAEDDERAAARNLNSYRSLKASRVDEETPSIDDYSVKTRQAPSRGVMRDDVAAAGQRQKATTANARLEEEKTKPSLDLFASFAMNGRSTTIDSTFSNSYSANRPTKTIGIIFSMPLDLDSASSSRRGAIHERDASEMLFRQQLLDQEQTWDDLQQSLTDAKERLDLAETIERSQKNKVVNERGRLTNGRTTTYQVLLFEQDFSQSQLGRLRAQSDVLSILTQMKLFSGDSL